MKKRQLKKLLKKHYDYYELTGLEGFTQFKYRNQVLNEIRFYRELDEEWRRDVFNLWLQTGSY